MRLRASLECTVVAAFLSAAGCGGSPFERLTAPEDGGADVALHDGGPQTLDSMSDAPRDGSFDERTDHEKPDVVARDTLPPDAANDPRDARDGMVDATHGSEAGSDAPPHGGADSSGVPDSSDKRDARTDAGGATDAGESSDASPADAHDGALADGLLDIAVSDIGEIDIAHLDTGTGIGADVTADVDPLPDGFVCGFAPPPPGGACPEVCNDGCVDGICKIGCREKHECKGATLECPTGFACEISCIGKQSCDSAFLICPPTHVCSLLCADAQSCKAVQLNCRSGTCGIECLGTDQACNTAVVNCGSQSCSATCQSADGRPTLNCGQSCDCRPCL